MQEAEKYGIKIGVYFFSSAITEEEATEEADWVADYVAKYPITYPVAYDCEGYDKSASRQYALSNRKRTDIAEAFMDRIYDRGYTPMFYSSVGALRQDSGWIASELEKKYKIWIAWYGQTDSDSDSEPVEKPNYDGQCSMWQYYDGVSFGDLDFSVDLNVAFFGYDGVEAPKDLSPREEVYADPEAAFDFLDVNEIVTAKEETNLRDIPWTGEDSTVLYTLKYFTYP